MTDKDKSDIRRALAVLIKYEPKTMQSLVELVNLKVGVTNFWNCSLLDILGALTLQDIVDLAEAREVR